MFLSENLNLWYNFDVKVFKVIIAFKFKVVGHL